MCLFLSQSGPELVFAAKCIKYDSQHYKAGGYKNYGV